MAASGRPEAGERLRRLLAILTLLAREGRVPVSELSSRFGISTEELVSDLELAACCGLPPYTPDQLMEIIVDGEEVVAHLGVDLARPRRLSPAEGFALAAAARAVAAVPGADQDGALSSAIEKLQLVLGDLGILTVDFDEPPALAALRKATDSESQVRLTYHSGSRDEVSERVVDPISLTSLEGRWYLDGWCHLAGGIRRFRVDRVLSVELTGEKATIPAHGQPAPSRDAAKRIGSAYGPAEGEDGNYVPGPGATVVKMAIDDDAMWVIDAVPTMSAEPLGDGRTEVTLGVSGVGWFERMLLRLGPKAEVLEPPEWRDVASAAAATLLARYEKT